MIPAMGGARRTETLSDRKWRGGGVFHGVGFQPRQAESLLGGWGWWWPPKNVGVLDAPALSSENGQGGRVSVGGQTWGDRRPVGAVPPLWAVCGVRSSAAMNSLCWSVFPSLALVTRALAAAGPFPCAD